MSRQLGTDPEPEPVEERIADRLSARTDAGDLSRAAAWVLRRLAGGDRAVYRAVARWPTPRADATLRRVSVLADRSKPWLAVAAVLALAGGARGRHAALSGVTAIAATSLVVNQPLKTMASRHRPDRTVLGVPEHRWVPMPTSRSFPSGHAASATAFAVAVGQVLPPLRPLLRGAAVVVGFSRVHTGVHYPSDVVVGSTVGALLGQVVPRLLPRILRRLRPRR